MRMYVLLASNWLACFDRVGWNWDREPVRIAEKFSVELELD